MGTFGVVLHEVMIASSNASSMSRTERRLELADHPLPIPLSTVADFDSLRVAIGRAGAAFGRPPRDYGGGNYTKRICLVLGWTQALRSMPYDLELLLAGRVGEAGDGVLLLERVEAERRNIRRIGAPAPPTGTDTPEMVLGDASRFVRRPDVIAWVLEAAEGVCGACGASAPFLRSNGEPYLEVHHVRPLADGGPDTIDNAVALCPNCHRQLHHGATREALRDSVLGKNPQLRDHPKRPDP